MVAWPGAVDGKYAPWGVFSFFVALLVAPSTAAEPYAPPSPPMNVTVSTAAEGIEVTWDAPLVDGGGELYYRVYRDGSLLADELLTLSFLDTIGAADFTQPTYSVTAVNDAGESSHATPCINPGPGVSPEGCWALAKGIFCWALSLVTQPCPIGE